MSRLEGWVLPPQAVQVTEGQLIRHRKTFEPPITSERARLGSDEPKVIVAETRGFVVYRTWAGDGRDLGESCVSRDEFEREFERGPLINYVDNTYERKLSD